MWTQGLSPSRFVVPRNISRLSELAKCRNHTRQSLLNYSRADTVVTVGGECLWFLDIRPRIQALFVPRLCLLKDDDAMRNVVDGCCEGCRGVAHPSIGLGQRVLRNLVRTIAVRHRFR